MRRCYGLVRSRASRALGLSRSSSVSSRPVDEVQKRNASSSSFPATPSPAFPGEFECAKVITSSVPGPRSQALQVELDTMQQVSTLHFFADYASSRGNYLVDADGNRYLDVLGQIASLPLGYNHPSMVEAMSRPENMSLLVQRPSLGLLPPTDWVERIANTLRRISPKGGLTEIATMMCGSCANENAFKAAFIWYQTRRRGGRPPTEEEMESCMRNSAPGSPSLSVLSFGGGFHGRLLGCMSATRSKAIHKVDFPAFDWPVAPFPATKYPLDAFREENAKEEAQCLEMAEDAIVARKDSNPVAAIIVEPILSEGGDKHASDHFFVQLRDIAARHGAAFIVDEVQTGGGGTGTFWAHERWNLENPPDIVTFSKKLQTGGYFAKPEFRPAEGYRIFNTWMGDPLRMIQLEVFLDTCEKDELLENTRITGEYLIEGLELLARRYPNLLSNVRGVGTYAALDFSSSDVRDRAVSMLRQHGAECAGCGDVSLRFRPALIFQPRHAAEILGILEQVCGKLMG